MKPVPRYAFASVALTGMLTAGLVALSPTAAQAASSQTFTADGTFNVPTGVTALNVVVTGAGGGSAPSPSTALPGVGGVATVSLAVTPGASLTVQVGGRGGNATDSGGAGGTHGGANGGNGFASASGGGGGGGGGGSSALISGVTTLALGGGGGGASNAAAGGAGGSTASGSGANGDSSVNGGTPSVGGSGATQTVVGSGGTNGLCPGGANNGAAGAGQVGGVGGADAGCGHDYLSGGGGGGGGFLGGGGGGGGDYDPGPSHFGGGGGGGGSSYINPTFGTGTFSPAPTVAAASVVISWSTEKTPQTPVGCGVPPKKVARNGTTVLTKAGCTTNAKQKVSVTASCKLRARGDVGYCRLVRSTNGSVSIKTYGYAMAVKIRWSAPATSTYKAYQQVKTYKV